MRAMCKKSSSKCEHAALSPQFPYRLIGPSQHLRQPGVAVLRRIVSGERVEIPHYRDLLVRLQQWLDYLCTISKNTTIK